MYRFSLVLAFLLTTVMTCFSQKDSIVLNNGDVITGKIKTMSSGVVAISTDYSDSDLKIKWKEIKDFYTQQYFRIVLSDGKEVFGRFISNIRDDRIIFEMQHMSRVIDLNDIKEVNNYEAKLIDRLDANIDFGYSYTRSKNLSQFTLRLGAKYYTNAYRSFVSINGLRSQQDGATNTERYEGNIGIDYYLGRKWFERNKYSFLSNAQQELKLRSVFGVGLGYFIVRNNRVVWDAVAGVDFNAEDYYPADQAQRRSMEAMFSSEVTVLDVADLDFSASVLAYPSLRYKERLRVDYKFDVKYNLPLDFYISIGTTLNYDNRPIKGAADYDFIFQTSIGWQI